VRDRDPKAHTVITVLAILIFTLVVTIFLVQLAKLVT
jgi:hypothetical protein